MAGRGSIWPFTFPLASIYRRTVLRGTEVIAVTGSSGKTTTTRAIAATLSQPFRHPDWGLNHDGFIAEALLATRPSRDALVVEVGAKFEGCMRRYAKLLRPDISVVTCIGTEHQENLGSVTKIVREKAELLRWLSKNGIAVLNGDDPNVLGMAHETRAASLTFGFTENCDVRAGDFRVENACRAVFNLHIDGTTHRQRTHLIGRHQVYALLAAAAVGLARGGKASRICQVLQELAPTPRRLAPIALDSGAVLLVDDYKSTLETVHAALATLDSLPNERKIIVLGEIYEPPGDISSVYRDVGKRAARVANSILFVGSRISHENLAKGAAEAGAHVHYLPDGVAGAARLLQEELTSTSVALLKGFGSQRFERIVLRLTGREVKCNRATCRASLTWPCATCYRL
jgi:UDP-N-acetylmuramoyl-tripeptide--D-alanyl-D-alanine ligase